MREIKFRAWDKNSKKMFFMNGITGSFFAFDGEDSLKLHPEVPIMQFTGLKDKNGKEIYEGDIVKLNRHVEGCAPDWTEEGFEVCWNNDNAKFNIKGKEVWELIWKMEVIGNIYENPELISN